MLIIRVSDHGEHSLPRLQTEAPPPGRKSRAPPRCEADHDALLRTT